LFNSMGAEIAPTGFVFWGIRVLLQA
jgi:hypothetical protein